MGLNPELWRGKRILVTGHTGFKGAWLTLMLKDLGCSVIGISLPLDGSKTLYREARLDEEVDSEFFQDIRDTTKLQETIENSKADYVFHLAAQAFVRKSFVDPIDTFTTNVIGTANVLDAALKSKSIRGVTVVTTDKVYENVGLHYSYKEEDKLGGVDPYSASKAAAELVTGSLRMTANPLGIPVTTVRAGNVIGGGDWGEDRLIPDLIRALISGSAIMIRNPNSTRPFQYVLDCLYGYLLVAQSHFEQKSELIRALNFGPKTSLEVMELVRIFESAIGQNVSKEITYSEMPESKWLGLDSTLAFKELGWRASFSPEQAAIQTAKWYSNYLNGFEPRELMKSEISSFKRSRW